MKSNFLKRLASTCVLLALFIPTLLWLKPKYFALVVIVLATFGLHEFYALVSRKRQGLLRLVGVVSGIFILFAMYYTMEYAYIPRHMVSMVLFLSLLAMFVVYIFEKRPVSDAWDTLALSFMGLMFVAWSGGHIIGLRYHPYGQYLIIFIIAVVKLGDIGAYLVGTRYGRHRVFPIISPKKSIEGCLGGFFVSIVAGIVWYALSLNIAGRPIFGWVETICLAAVLNLLGQFGDVSESLLKRQFDVKDSGVFVPGIGGLLDLVDSLIFTVPFLYYYHHVRVMLVSG